MSARRSSHFVGLLLAVILISGLFIYCNRQTNEKQQKQDGLEGRLSISGAFALYPMTVKWADEFIKRHPQVRIDISAGGAGKGMTDALSGMVDLGMFSRGVSREEIAKGAWYIAVTNDGVLATVNASNPVWKDLETRGLTKAEFQRLFLSGESHYWEEYSEGAGINRVNVYTRSDACGAAEMWGKYLGQNQEALTGTGVFGDPGMADAIRHDPLGIGYNNVVYAYDMKSRMKYEGMEVVPIDLDANGRIDSTESFYGTLDEIMDAIQSGSYPSPPARDLYFVSKGKPSNLLAIAFLEWILTEGQQYVAEAGYVRLSDEKIAGELAKLRP